jgi:hypothetical protein
MRLNPLNDGIRVQAHVLNELVGLGSIIPRVNPYHIARMGTNTRIRYIQFYMSYILLPIRGRDSLVAQKPREEAAE